jgi:rubrerythrin
MFEGRKLLIVTKHGKEQVFASVFEKALGVRCVLDNSFDTDQLGTFSGEVDRTLDPMSAAKQKCLEGMRQSGCDLAIANEGSFGPHPTLFFVPADEELLVLIDSKNKLELVVRELSTATNFNAGEITTVEELFAFAKQAQFPSHALILRPAKANFQSMVKGIHEQAQLLEVFESLKSQHPSVYVETDMRAMHNPSRMKVIAAAAEKMLSLIHSTCPQCQTPGFTVSDYIRGLPCSLCGRPTRSLLAQIYTCKHCNYQKEKSNPENKDFEDPMYCDYCNP